MTEHVADTTDHLRDDPDRYSHGEIECIDAIRAALSPEEFRGFCKGEVIKYVWREAYKGGGEDMAKARDYIDYMLGITTGSIGAEWAKARFNAVEGAPNDGM